MSSLKDDLSGPGIELIETHTAWVFLGAETVLKVKKPVDYGFLDFTTIDRRKAVCEAEVRLNARLAPDVYHGVLPVARDASGKHRVGGHGEVVDYAVKMRRLPDAIRGDVLLDAGRLELRHVDALAEHLARFHASLDATVRDASPYGAPDAIGHNVSENFVQAHAAVRTSIGAADAVEIERAQTEFLKNRRALFEARVAAGRVRDGHGDLRLEHVYFESKEHPTIIDCLEFVDRFRYADVCCDIAFLSMDMRRLGRADLAERFIARYARASGDYELYELVDFYEGYRAYVRGKVASLLAADVGADPDVRASANEQARAFFLMSLLEDRKSLLEPVLVAVGGIIASGKSTVSERLSRAMGAPVVSADHTRKNLLGVAETTPVRDGPFGGAYTPEYTARVYAEVFARAAHVLASRRSVVIDASFRSRADRERARELARERGVRFVFVECHVSIEESRRRLAEREESPSVSDGRRDILDDFVRRFEPVTELSEREHFVVDTTRPPEESLVAVLPELPTWPDGFVR